MALILVGAMGPAWAGMEEANRALARSDYEGALAELRPLAETGNAQAQFELGIMMSRGMGLPKDDAAAAAWLRRAADQGLADAQGALGVMTLEGRGVEKDENAALDLLKAAAAKGNDAAAISLGNMAQAGRVLPKSLGEAAHWLRQAADRGNAQAENSLGMLYWSGGDDLPANAAEAVNWFRRAAVQGWGAAQYNLGKAMELGVGTPQNTFEAYVWVSLAAARAKVGDKVFGERDAIAARLPPELLARAQERASQFRPMSAAQAGSASGVPGASYGTGFVVRVDGTVVTNAHVVTNCREIFLSNSLGKGVPATLAAKDDVNDLALLKSNLPISAVAAFRADPGIRPGDGVVVVGFPLKGMLSSDPIVTSGAVSALSGIRDDARYMQVTAPLQQGNSGGPLLDMTGNVVGVVSAKLNALAVANATGDVPQNVNFAIKSVMARQFLESNGVAYLLMPSDRDYKPADIVERARGFVTAVECRR